MRYRTPVFTQLFSWRLHITITYNVPHLLICRGCHSNSVDTGSSLPNISDVKIRKRRNMIGIDMIRTSVLHRMVLKKKLTANTGQLIFFEKVLMKFI